MPYKIGSVQLDLFPHHPYNNTSNNERSIELPLCFWFLEKYKEQSIVEVGEVSCHYKPPQHTIIDLMTEKPGTIKANALEYCYQNKHVVSISTVEHIGRADYKDKISQEIDDSLAYKCVEKIIKESDTFLITFPVGANIGLDRDMQRYMDPSQFKIIVRKNKQNTIWEEDHSKSFNYTIKAPFPAGNAIVILTNIPELINEN